MPWKAIEHDPFAEDGGSPEPAPDAVRNGGNNGDKAPGFLSQAWSGLRDAVTGDSRTEFPDAPEFLPTYSQMRGPEGQLPELGASMRSAISPDPEAQFDILSKNIPGLQRSTDKFGNMMLKAPGMQDWTYLNKPGVSGRDFDEFGTQTLATLPLLGWAGKAGSVVGNIARGAIGMGAASVAQDVAAGQMGSEQGIDENRAGVSAGLGAAVPAAAPLVRGAVGAVASGYNRVMDPVRKLSNPQGYAERELRESFKADARQRGIVDPFDLNTSRSDASHGVTRMTPHGEQTAASRGQDMRVVDYGGETIKAQARKAANQSPAARDELMRVIGPRAEGQAGRLLDFMEGELGFTNSAKQVGDQLRQQARMARQPLYDQAYRQGAQGYDSPAFQKFAQAPTFARAMQRATSTMKDRANIPGLFTTGMRGQNGYTLEFWDQVKQRLGDMEGKAIKQGAKNRAMEIGQMRRTLTSELDRAFPNYAPARGMAESFFDAADALEAGKKFASQRFNLQDATQAIGQLNPQERKLFAEGYASEFIDNVRRSPDRNNILNRIAASDADRNKFRLAMGGRADQLETFLRLEAIMDTAVKAMGNSTTARQLVELGMGYGAPIVGSALSSWSGDPSAMVIGALIGGGKLANQAINRQVAEHVAKLLTSKNPELFLKGLQQASKPGFLDALRAIDNAIADAGLYRAVATQKYAQSGQKADEISPEHEAMRQKARDALARGADRGKVEERLKQYGIDARGL